MDVSSQMGPFSIVPEWVLDRGLSPTGLKLYIVMARFADWHTGMAFPSRDTLAERMGCSLKTVDRAVQEVVAMECVKKISRGRYASALYQVYQVDPRGTDLSTEETDLSSEGTDLSSRLDKNDHLTRTTKQEPLQRELLNNRFDEFWAVYPLKKDKRVAFKAFERAMKRASIEDIIAGAERYRDDPNREDAFTKYPQGWLNADAWDNGPLPARNQKLTNSQRNIQNFRQKLALLEQPSQKEITHGQDSDRSVTDFGISLRSADSY